MRHRDDKNLGIIALESSKQMGIDVDAILRYWNNGESHLISASCPRFGTGEGKGTLNESIRGKDLFILVDICNSSITYMMDGYENRMSPDDHYQDLKRIIAACNGRAETITVIMPFLYEGRQHRRNGRESLDCAMMLRELETMGVHDIITFDAHDPRVQNSVPFSALDSISPMLQMVETLLKEIPSIKIEDNSLMVIAPDEGATRRAILLSSLFGVNMGMCYKRRDYTKIVNGKNPIVAHEFCGGDVKNKDVIITDDMISSGESMIDCARDIKKRGASRIFLFSTFGLFTNGLESFDNAYNEHLFDKVFCTNLTYQKPELETREWYCSVDMSMYLAAIIDTLYQGHSLSRLVTPIQRMKDAIDAHKLGFPQMLGYETDDNIGYFPSEDEMAEDTAEEELESNVSED